MQEILIEVATNGNTTISTKGFQGKACQEVTKQIEQALGSVTKDTATREMHETEPQRLRQ